MSYRCVPFSESWITSEKVDAQAVYKRPHRTPITGEIVRDAHGLPTWDYSVLPVRRHNDWLGKGFEYVTIANAESLGMVAGSLRAAGLDPRDFIMDPRTNSPWAPDKYAAVAQQDAQTEIDRLRTLVDKYGVEATEEMLRITLPEELRSRGKQAPKKAGAAA
jgi:hypothetical protein